MSELNPHIVKETEGDFENTIQHFVTGRPLSAEEMLPDSHGVHPVSPLGFMMKPSGKTLSRTEPLTAFSAYTVYSTCQTCGGTGTYQGNPCQSCDGTGSIQVTEQEAYAASYVVSGKYYMYDSGVISFPVTDIHRNADGTRIVVTVKGLLPQAGTDSIYFTNLTTDDYTPTGLVGEGVSFVPESVTRSEDAGTTQLVVVTAIVFDGVVGGGKLAMGVNTGKTYLAIEDSESDTLSGIYVLGETEGEPIRKIFNRYPNDGTDTRPACYAANGYSDSEVADWVSARARGVARYGCHPSSEAGDLRDAGGLVTWFTTCGDVDISGGAGNNAVIVPGFGLGCGYFDSAGTGEPKAATVADPDDSAERKWLTFGYGTKSDAVRTDVSKTALPMDWPFTEASSYAGKTLDNNITLIKDGVLFDDGTTRKVLGGLTRVSRECHVCSCTGVVGDTICPNCQGTGEEPDCPTCGGTGSRVNPGTGETETCPDCDGVGFTGGHRYVMDKVHVCLYNDFKPGDDGTTVLKKTFVNLATPITQKDGDSFEVTVSLPNVGLDDAYSSGDQLKNLSGYYSYVSQPRVYVVSGTWKFSETKVSVSTDDLLTYDLGGTAFKDADGNDLPDGTDVRVRILFDAYRGKKFSAVGTLSSGTIVLSGELDIPAGILRKIRKSADSDGHIHGSICGAAYVEPNNATLPSAVKTNIGLNAVRNAAGALGGDSGTGQVNSLQQYNKLYTADPGDSGRKHVLFESGTTPRQDQRQVVATVYPTVTNTFPWALTHRRKLGFLDRLMTMDADGGVYGMFSRIYRMNRQILQAIPMESAVTAEDYPLDMYRSTSWMAGLAESESESLSVIGTLLTIVDDGTAVPTSAEAQPVRRALKAARLLAGDYRNARTSRLLEDEDSMSAYLSGYRIRKDGSAVSSFSSLGQLIDMTVDNDYERMANAVRLRHLPAILASAGTDPLTMEPLSPVLEAYPYSDPAYSYYSGNPYGYGAYDTTSRTEEIPCEVAASTGTEAWAVKNSIVEACVGSKVSDPEMVEELYRAAELADVNFGEPDTVDNIIRPNVYRSGEHISWMELVDAFTKIVSPDNIPVPALTQAFRYDDVYTLGTNDEQLPFIMGDAYGYYRILNGWEAEDRFIATTMPTDDALSLFLKEYVPGYAARLAIRNWDSMRVKVMDGTSSSGNTTYLTRMKWYDPGCDAASRGIYASDAFLVGNAFADMNMNRIEFSGEAEARSLNCSVPPYSVTSDYSTKAPFATQNDRDSVGYIRVFMRFMFSEEAGRWYCVDYRQAPISYLSPLYGAKALDQTIDGKRIWVRPACDSSRWQDYLTRTYGEYRPMDINPELIRTVMAKDVQGRCRLTVPYLPVANGGLGLNAPVNASGTTTTEAIQTMPHANFWSVREHLRPATGAVAAGDIPRYYSQDDEWCRAAAGGIMSDPVLWGQYDYPMKGAPDYHMPDPEIPDYDRARQVMVYGERNGITRRMDTGDIQVGPSDRRVIAFSDGVEHEE